MNFIQGKAQQLLQKVAKNMIQKAITKRIREEAIKEAQVQVQQQTFFSTFKKAFQSRKAIKEAQVQVQEQYFFSTFKKVFQKKTGSKSLMSQPQQNKLAVFRNEKWENPKPILLTRTTFDKYQMEPIKKIKCMRKLEPFSNFLKESFQIMKVVVNKQDIFYASDPQIIKEYFTKIILVKLIYSSHGIQPSRQLFKKTQGYLLKKNFLGFWEQVYVTIDQKEGLKCQESKYQPHDLQIKYINEIWTWFEVILDQNLIIKFKRTKLKRQFAIQVNLLYKWIPAFMSLLSNPQI